MADSLHMQADPIARAASTDRRHFPRWTTAGLESALGRVTDLSMSGLRIRKTGNPGLREGDRFRLEVRHGSSVFLLPAQLASIRPHGGEGAGGMVDLGIRFPDLTKAQKRAVKSVLTSVGFPDGGGEIVFQGLPEESGKPAATLQPDSQPAPGQRSEVTGKLQSLSVATGAPTLPAAIGGAGLDAFAASPGGALRSWTQLTQAVDASTSREPQPAPDRSPRPAPPPMGALSADEAAELRELRAFVAAANRLAEEASGAAAGTGTDASVPPSRPHAAAEADTPSLPPRGEAGNQRKNGRLAAQDAHTALGEVLDISASGMRIRRRGARAVNVGDQFLLDLYVCGRAVRLPVEVMRIQKSGWRSHEYGLRFGELPAEMRAQFGQLARMAARHVSIG